MKSNKGFTLVEIIITVLIIGIMTALVSFAIYKYMSDAALNTDIQNLERELDALYNNSKFTNCKSELKTALGGYQGNNVFVIYRFANCTETSPEDIEVKSVLVGYNTPSNFNTEKYANIITETLKNTFTKGLSETKTEAYNELGIILYYDYDTGEIYLDTYGCLEEENDYKSGHVFSKNESDRKTILYSTLDVDSYNRLSSSNALVNKTVK